MAPRSRTSLKFSKLQYALSADTSLISKLRAVDCNISLKYGLSPAFAGVTSTAVTMFVNTPHIKCALTHFRLSPIFDLPNLASTQRPKREVEKPVESTANVVSRFFRTELLSITI